MVDPAPFLAPEREDPSPGPAPGMMAATVGGPGEGILLEGVVEAVLRVAERDTRTVVNCASYCSRARNGRVLYSQIHAC